MQLAAINRIIPASIMPKEKQKLEISEDRFNSILRRLIEHKAVPKKVIEEKRKGKKKLKTVL